MDTTVLDVNLVNEYSNIRECRQETVKYLKTLSESFRENTTPLERQAFGQPVLKFKCRKLPFRKS